MIPTTNIDTSSLLAKALDTKKSYGRGRGSFGKTNSRFCIHCNKHEHIIEFFYQKNDHPQIHKNSSIANV